MKEKDIIKYAISEIDKLCQKIINKENYMIDMPACIQAINQACEIILKYNNHSEEIIPILEDVMYGMTQRDEVFLLDVLRYGMMVGIGFVRLQVELPKVATPGEVRKNEF